MIKRQTGIALLTLLLVACGQSSDGDLTIYTNATIWTGSYDPPAPNSALLVRNGTVEDVVPVTELEIPDGAETVDLSDRYLIPGLINAHGHVGMARGLETGPNVHSEENVIEQLQLYARYGITTVVSLGDEPPHAFAVRDGVDPSSRGMARLFMSGPVLNPQSPDEARRMVSDLMEQRPDWTKIRVDNRAPGGQNMSADVFGATIEASHEYGVPLAAHIVALDDAKGVVRSGADLVAHSVRDERVDDELIELMLERDICITPTLTREISVFIYAERPDFFDDPYFLRDADPEVIEQLQQPELQQRYTGSSADFFRRALPLAKENMIRLHNAGVRIALGTDSGPPARFQGYFEQMEIEIMQEAGMLPGEILLSATRYAAECMRIDHRVGTLRSGNLADFLVVGSNPFDDVRNLREIEAVYIGGIPIPLDR